MNKMENNKLTVAERFAALGERLKKDGRLQIDAAKVELSEQVFQAMQDKGITEAELSRRLGTSRAYVNKVLQGDTNFTIESLVKIGIALECDLKLELVESKKKEKDFFDDNIIYIEVEQPIAAPRIVSKPFGYQPDNVFNFADFKVNQTVKDVTGGNKSNQILEKNDAAVQNAA